MKKAITILVLSLFFVSEGFSQTEKNNFVIGGASNLIFTSTKSKAKTNTQEVDGEKVLNLSFGPAAGFFVTNNLAVGLQLPISYSESEIEFFDGFGSANGKIKTTSVILAPFTRYYFSKTNIKPFLQAQIGVGSSKSKFTDAQQDSEGSANIFMFGFDGGVAIFINNNISIDLGVGYGSTTSRPEEDNDNDIKFINNIIGFNAGINIFI